MRKIKEIIALALVIGYLFSNALYPFAGVSAVTSANSYYAYPILEWNQGDHAATFGIEFNVNSILSITYYTEIWIQLYYKETDAGSAQLLYDTKVNASTLISHSWSKTYSFTSWQEGKHLVALNLNWVDNMNLTNWSQEDGSPLSPYSEWNGVQWSHHIEWSKHFDFTTISQEKPVDLTPIGVAIGAIFLVTVVGAFISEVKPSSRRNPRKRKFHIKDEKRS